MGGEGARRYRVQRPPLPSGVTPHVNATCLTASCWSLKAIVLVGALDKRAFKSMTYLIFSPITLTSSIMHSQ